MDKKSANTGTTVFEPLDRSSVRLGMVSKRHTVGKQILPFATMFRGHEEGMSHFRRPGDAIQTPRLEHELRFFDSTQQLDLDWDGKSNGGKEYTDSKIAYLAADALSVACSILLLIRELLWFLPLQFDVGACYACLLHDVRHCIIPFSPEEMHPNRFARQ